MVTLKPIEKAHLPLIQSWRNSKEVMSFCRQYRPLSMEDMNSWYDTLHQDRDYNLTNDLFLLENNGKPIGVGGLVRIDWRNRKAEVSFYVAKRKYKRFIREALSLLLAYAFKTLNIRKVYFPCYSFCPYLAIYEKVLKREYIAKEEYYWEGRFWDRVVLVAYNEKG